MLDLEALGTGKPNKEFIFNGDIPSIFGLENNPLVRFFEYQEEPTMEGFDPLSFLPVVHAEEKDNIVYVRGFSAAGLVKDIQRVWNTTKIANNIFLELNARRIIFHSFFAVEVIYILERITQDSKARNTSKSTIESIKKEIIKNSWLGESAFAEPLPYDLKKPTKKLKDPSSGRPFNYLASQKGYIERYAEIAPTMNVTGAINHSDPGTGKTMASFAFHYAFDVDITINVVPKPTLEDVWVKTYHTGLVDKPPMWDSTRKDLPTGKETFIFVHYESLKRVVEALRGKLRGKKISVWLDESHNFVESSAARTETFVELCQDADPFAVTWASGTPIKAMGSEMIPVLKTCDRRLFNESVEKAFKKVYGMSTSHALDILNHRISKMKFRAEKHEVVDNDVTDFEVPVRLPEWRKYTLPVVAERVKQFVEEQLAYYKREMPAYEKRWDRLMASMGRKINSKYYRDFENYKRGCLSMHRGFDPIRHKDVMQWCKRFEKQILIPLLDREEKREFKDVASVYKYVVLVVRGQALGRIVTRERINCFVDIAKHADYTKEIERADSKTLIFTNYVEVAKTLHEKYTDLGYHPVIVIGETNAELEANLNRSRTDRRCRVVIATLKSLGTGVPMIHCSTLIFNDRPFRKYLEDQAKARIDRKGQPYPVRMGRTNLDTDGIQNLSGRVDDIIAWSSEQVDAMLGTNTIDVDLGEYL